MLAPTPVWFGYYLDTNKEAGGTGKQNAPRVDSDLVAPG